VVWFLWVVSELVAMATDLAEFLGAALGFHLLFGIPLFPAGLLTAAVTFAILGLQRYGYRPVEAVIGALVGVIAVAYLVETLLESPDWAELARAAVTPRLTDAESILLATGILGATVMPHVIFLHSALVQHRIPALSVEQAKRLFHLEVVDVVLAMGVAGLINAAMVVMAASTFYRAGLSHVASIEEAYRNLQPLLGDLAGVMFAVSLLASGLSSSTVGTMAGQVVMQGYLRRHVPLWLRRLVTMAPALLVIGLGFDPTWTLVLSQVVLSFGIPFALVPLIRFTGDRRLMGELANHPLTSLLAWAVTVLIVALNSYLLWRSFSGGLVP
jgi:manganese transport protein